MNVVLDLIKTLDGLSDEKRAKASAWFFKTGKGQYGEGDKFIGISVPKLRKVAKEFKHIGFSDLERLLRSKIHEHRFLALEILVMQYEGGDAILQKKIVDFYIKNSKFINNWDLVDTSASYILGHYLLKKNKKILYKFARSSNIWERRIAIISTIYFISQESYLDTLKIAEILLKDKHDLIHKAVGWALREVGKKSQETEIEFLEKHYKVMPRTMLRYAIEKFSDKKRIYYLTKK